MVAGYVDVCYRVFACSGIVRQKPILLFSGALQGVHGCETSSLQNNILSLAPCCGCRTSRSSWCFIHVRMKNTTALLHSLLAVLLLLLRFLVFVGCPVLPACPCYIPPQYVTSNPYVRIEDVMQEDEFLILASDGLWDVMSNEVRESRRGGKEKALPLLIFSSLLFVLFLHVLLLSCWVVGEAQHPNPGAVPCHPVIAGIPTTTHVYTGRSQFCPTDPGCGGGRGGSQAPVRGGHQTWQC